MGAPFSIPPPVPRMWIAGALVSATGQAPVLNPATLTPVTTAPLATCDDLDRAVDGARAAQPGWANRSFTDRAATLGRMADVLIAHVEELAWLTTLEQGKPLTAARGEVMRAAGAMREIAGIEIPRQTIRSDATGRVDLIYRPLGVIGAITPWNVPLILAAPKIASALYAGNAVILKPAPTTPLASLRMGELWAQEIASDDLPPGLVSILSGGNDLGTWMTAHAGIDKISFTGSVESGKKVMAASAGTLKRVTLELGGNDPAILLDDVDIPSIVPALFGGAFGLSGQLCMGIKRLYASASIYEDVVAAMTAAAKAAVVGDGTDPDVTVGPVQNEAQYRRVLDLIEDTRRQPGVRITAGGRASERTGYFIEPTIVADIAEGTRIVDEEQFGPVLPILKYDTVDEAVHRANASEFGLGASVWTQDVARGAEIAARLEAGYTWVNSHVGTTRDLPFGGIKQSGIGRQGHFIGVTSDMEPQVIVIPAAGTADESRIQALEFSE
ncbi:aldehyde dehydrogenase family protein [Psychromarinibacter halotolerans]|uniref:Aldehyde dehydrogenase family protein n=1 Tax=Psychromarinibacter halotolerans TaxID=1775175 RepID=A0ABV7GV74_9RHOB|nr:aldehyde dehydrogenase family protein [Psychromarinibacter halotolerans]MDF0596302.1 aldehyde dehydrogenase family protein [Psychromarinibacter halotolerans]